MTDEEWKILKPFAEAKAFTEQRYNAVLVMNKPQDPKAAMEQSLHLERVWTEYRIADKALIAARKELFGL